jgi:hypothetical protein
VHRLAYLDSGSVSLVVSAVVAGFAGILVVVKMGFRHFTSLFSPKQRAALKEEKAQRAAASEALEAQQAQAGAATTATGETADAPPAQSTSA